MSERIRYREISENVFLSVHVYHHATNGAQYRVVINDNTQEWAVIDAHTKIIAIKGEFSNKARAMINIRKALKSLGIQLTTGTRK
jgi:hypothetical protein